MLAKLESHARGIVETKAKEEAAKILIRMKDRFITLFSRDADQMPRIWTGNEDIKSITKFARSQSLKLLSVLSVVRLDDEPDNIDKILSLALLESKGSSSSSSNSKALSDPLAASTWDKVPSSKTLISPVHCKSVWRQFQMETEYTVSQAISAQEASKRGNNWLPPPWAIVALIILGFNEFMTVLKNPLYLVIIFVGYLLTKAVWAQMDVSNYFSHGLLPGLLALSTRLLPAIMNILKRLAEDGNQPPVPAAPQPPLPTAAATSSGSSRVAVANGSEHSSTSKED